MRLLRLGYYSTIVKLDCGEYFLNYNLPSAVAIKSFYLVVTSILSATRHHCALLVIIPIFAYIFLSISCKSVIYNCIFLMILVEMIDFYYMSLIWKFSVNFSVLC